MKRPPFLFKKVLRKAVSKEQLEGAFQVERGVGWFLHRAVPLILDGFDLNLSAAHLDGGAMAGTVTRWKLVVEKR